MQCPLYLDFTLPQKGSNALDCIGQESAIRLIKSLDQNHNERVLTILQERNTQTAITKLISRLFLCLLRRYAIFWWNQESTRRVSPFPTAIGETQNTLCTIEVPSKLYNFLKEALDKDHFCTTNASFHKYSTCPSAGCIYHFMADASILLTSKLFVSWQQKMQCHIVWVMIRILHF